MADIKEIKGLNIPARASDPANPVVGEIWYNTTSNITKGRVFQASAWSTAPNLPYSTRDASGFGTQTAGVIFGGTVPSPLSTVNEYDGTSFTTVTSIPVAIGGLDSDGPQTAGLTAGGNIPGSPLNNVSSFDYNGSTWTSNSNLNVARTGHATIGNTAAQTAAIAISGEGTPTSNTTTSDWDGSTWTAGAAIPGWAQGTSGGGTTAAAFVNANVGDGDETSDYNGTTWSAGNNSNHQHNYGGAGGLATAGITYGGTQVPNPGVRTAQAELYDGTCWTSDASMNEARSNAHGKATISAPSVLVASGNPGPPGSSNAAEEYNAAGPVTVTVSSS